MSVFTPAEITYLQSQRLARVATSGPGGQPHVVPVSFRYNPDEDTIDVGGHGFAQRKKYRDVQRNPRIAIVIDDLATVDPWRPRMIEIRGQADILPIGGAAIGPGFDPQIFRIRPSRIVSIGIDGDEPFSATPAQSRKPGMHVVSRTRSLAIRLAERSVLEGPVLYDRKPGQRGPTEDFHLGQVRRVLKRRPDKSAHLGFASGAAPRPRSPVTVRGRRRSACPGASL